MLLAKRFQQAVYQAAAASNKAAGTGGGSGLVILGTLGTSNQTGGAQNFSSLTYATITGTSMSVVVSRPVPLLLLAIYTCKLTVGANNGLVRINPGAAGAATGGSYNGAPYYITQMAYEYLTLVQPGSYTMKLEAAVDNVASTLQLLGSNLTVLQCGM